MPEDQGPRVARVEFSEEHSFSRERVSKLAGTYSLPAEEVHQLATLLEVMSVHPAYPARTAARRLALLRLAEDLDAALERFWESVSAEWRGELDDTILTLLAHAEPTYDDLLDGARWLQRAAAEAAGEPVARGTKRKDWELAAARMVRDLWCRHHDPETAAPYFYGNWAAKHKQNAPANDYSKFAGALLSEVCDIPAEPWNNHARTLLETIHEDEGWLERARRAES